MPKQLRHACRFLQHDEKIADFLAAIKRNAQLLGEIRDALPSPLSEHCLHASLRAGGLTLLTDSPVWSSRLRFFAPELYRRLAPHHGPVITCRVRVQPPACAPSTALGASAKHRLSAKTVQHLMEAAAGIEDEQIASALRRLAKAGARDR